MAGRGRGSGLHRHFEGGSHVFRKAEVAELQLLDLVTGKKNIRRLNIAVDDSGFECMEVGDGPRERPHDSGRLGRVRWASHYFRSKRLSFDVLHREIGNPFVLTSLKDRDDVLVNRVCVGLDFLKEPSAQRLAREMRPPESA